MFSLLADKYLNDKYSPKQVAPQCGLSEEEIFCLAEEIATIAFNKSLYIDQEWVDFRGEKRSGFIGRPVSFHAMRGIWPILMDFKPVERFICFKLLLVVLMFPGGFWIQTAVSQTIWSTSKTAF